MEVTAQLAESVLAAQPFSRLLQAGLTGFAPGQATIVVPLTPVLEQQNGFAHGGVLAYAADNAITFAGGSVLGPSVLTSGLALEYLRPAAGVELQARATVIASTSRTATCRCDVGTLDEAGAWTLCATALGRVSQAARTPSPEGETPLG